MESSFDADAFVRRIGERLVEQFNDARAATTPATVGAAMEQPVREQLEQILPRGIGVGSGFVIDSYGATSRQSDIVLYEKDICPVFSINGTPETTYYPCECVVAVGEVKSRLDSGSLRDAFEKVGSVKRLRRHVVRHPIPLPETGEQIPIYRNYGSLQGDSFYRADEKPGDRAQIFGFVLAGEIRMNTDSLMPAFLGCSQELGDDYSPNLLVALSGVTLCWGEVSDERPGEVVKDDGGKYSLKVSHGGPLAWRAKWSAQTATHLGRNDGDDSFRALIRWIRLAFQNGRTSEAGSLDRYFEMRETSGSTFALPKNALQQISAALLTDSQQRGASQVSDDSQS